MAGNLDTLRVSVVVTNTVKCFIFWSDTEMHHRPRGSQAHTHIKLETTVLLLPAKASVVSWNFSKCFSFTLWWRFFFFEGQKEKKGDRLSPYTCSAEYITFQPLIAEPERRKSLTLCLPFQGFRTPCTGCQPVAVSIHRGPENVKKKRHLKNLAIAKTGRMRLKATVHTWLQGLRRANSVWACASADTRAWSTNKHFHYYKEKFTRGNIVTFNTKLIKYTDPSCVHGWKVTSCVASMC